MCEVKRSVLFLRLLIDVYHFSLLWFPVTTPCGHVFCRECLIRSVDNTQTLCPICKSSLDEVGKKAAILFFIYTEFLSSFSLC